MRSAKGYVRVAFGGVEFSGPFHGDTMVTVPLAAFKRILQAGKFRARLDFSIEHDGPGYEHDEEFDAERTKRFAEQELKFLDRKWGRPHLLYLNPKAGLLSYCPHSNLSYTLKELPKEAGQAVPATVVESSR